MALALGLRLVAWAHGSKTVQSAPEQTDAERERLLRRYHVAREVQREREQAAANAMAHVRRVM